MTSDIRFASPPALSDPSGWFDYYDRDRSNNLDRDEVVSGLLHTLHSYGGEQSAQSVRETVDAVFPAFDHDGSGTIDKREFCAPGGMAEALLAATAQDQQPQSQDRGFTSAYPGASRPSRPSQQAYVPHAQAVYAPAPSAPPASPPSAAPSSGSGYWACTKCTFVNKASDRACKACGGRAPAGAGGGAPQPMAHHAPPPPQQTHYPAQQTAHQQHQQQTTRMKTVRVNIPPGMKPGQKLRVLTGSGSDSVVVTIPDKRQWRAQTRHGQPFFDIQVPKKPKPAKAPVVVQGSYVSGPGGHSAISGRPSTSGHPTAATASRPSGPAPAWVAWERFRGHQYNPVPLQMLNVPCSPVSSLSNVTVSGRRRALLIGINYRGTRAALRGCVNDADNMEQLLARQGFPTDSCHMVKLVDEKPRGQNYVPTRANILKALQWLIQGASEGDVLFFHYSGHGAQIPDKTGHEADGYNETILPVDYKTGQITDDELWGSLVYPLPAGVRLTSVMDCCHSGTGLDLPYECNIHTGQWKEDINPAHAQADAILFSGCEDSQTSADAFDKYQAGGAMTQSFIKAYQENPMALYPEFMAAIHRHLKRRGFKQRPQLTASQRFDVRSRIFSFVDGIQPNHNPQIGRMKRRHVRPAKAGYKNSNMNDLLFNAGGAMALAGLASLFLD